MLLTEAQIDKSVAWLRLNASPPVKYLTAKYLSGRDRVAGNVPMAVGSASVAYAGSVAGGTVADGAVPDGAVPDGATASDPAELWSAVDNSPDARELFAAQRADGSWCSGGSWATKPPYQQKSRSAGYDPESPKYVTTIWVLPLLGELGFTHADARIKAACEYILNFKEFSSYYDIFNTSGYRLDPTAINFCCRFAQYLIALGKVGFSDDVRVRRGYAALLDAQRPDGGWASTRCLETNNWTRSCPAASYHSALALYSAGDPTFRDRIVKALGFLSWHLSTKTDDELRHFVYRWHSLVHELLMFTEYGLDLDARPIRIVIDWLLTMYRPAEGFFRYIGKPVSRYRRREDGMDPRVAKYRLYHLIEDDWLTYWLTRISVKMIESGR